MLKDRIDVAAGRKKADLVLKNASYVDVFNCRVLKGDIAVSDGKIVGTGEYEGEEEIDLSGKIVLPGLIDGHVHIESSQLSPEEFARVIVPHGTTTIIADPHEITNVCGMKGVEYIRRAAENVPLDIKIQLPSCVPSTPFETSGAILDGDDISENITSDYINGLGEFMNYPGVVNCDNEVIKKLTAAAKCGKIVDGHAPSLSGNALNAYVAGGITTDHECVTPEEMEEKISKGMYCHLRHSSVTDDLVNNWSVVNSSNMRRVLMCTDDRHLTDLIHTGHIDDALRVAVRLGMNPFYAICAATINNAECYSLRKRGAIAPDYYADMAVVDNLNDFNVSMVFKDGKLVAKDGKPLYDTTKRYLPADVLNTVKIDGLTPDDFKIKLKGTRAHVIKVLKNSVVTGHTIREVKSVNGDVDIKGTDMLKLAVVERHHRTGNIGLGLLEGYGFKGGCLGITVSHDSHNLILLSDRNEDMAKAASKMAEIGGGMVLVRGDEVFSVPFDIGGLMSSKSAEELEAASSRIQKEAYSMGISDGLDAFLSLAFLSLAVIPSLKLTDFGLFDVDSFKLIDINA